MEKEKKFTYQGFILHSEEELLEAKKESEAISYIKSQADLSNVKVAIKVYNRLIEKETLVTVLGVEFLKNLREQILASGVVAESSLKALPRAKSFQKETEKKLSKEQKLIEYYRDKTKNQMIVIIALCAVIVVMFLIRIFGSGSPFKDYEQKVLNEYGGWQDELTLKEQQLRAWEQDLYEREAAIGQQNSQTGGNGSQNNAD